MGWVLKNHVHQRSSLYPHEVKTSRSVCLKITFAVDILMFYSIFAIYYILLACIRMLDLRNNLLAMFYSVFDILMFFAILYSISHAMFTYYVLRNIVLE
jgi:hypothetical protein